MSRRLRRAILLALVLCVPGCPAGRRDAPRRTAGDPPGVGAASTWTDSALRALAQPDRGLAVAESLDVAGEPVAALKEARRQLALNEQRHGKSSVEAAAAMLVVARFAQAQGDFETAHRLDAAALEVRRRVYGERHPLVAQSMLQLAGDLKNEGSSWRDALKLYRQALLLRREIYPPGSLEIGESLMGIANMHRAMNQPDSARAEFLEALALRRRLVPPDSDAVAATLTAMSLVSTQSSDWPAAEPLLREAVLIRRRLADSRAGGLEMSLSTYGMTLRNLGRSASAESILAECAALRESLRRSSSRGRGRAARFDLSVYWQLAAAQLDRGRGEAAWVSVERGMSRTLIESLFDRGAIDTLGLWRNALARVQRTLEPNEAIIGWLELKRGAGREGYPFWCYCLRDRGPVRWHRVEGPTGDMWHGSSDALYDYKTEVHAAAGWPLRLADTSEPARLGRAVYSLRIAPLEPDLRGVSRLIVVSPDIMRGVPVEALSDSGGRWLGERFEIAYTPSALWGSLRSRHARTRRAPGPWRALLVGDPVYARSGQGGNALAASGGSAATRRNWPRLGASRAEIEAVAALAPHATKLLGADASESRLHELAVTGALARYDLIHFAIHAQIDERWPGRSALVLSESAGPAVPGDATTDAGIGADGVVRMDGLVTVDEIASQWRLDARLVSLAACSSVLGPVSQVEGYIGFEQALLGAGAHALLVSLWHVDDEATALLMRRFYANLLGGTLPAAAALREAQQWLRTLAGPSGSHPYAHPVYWAGIALVGDPG